MTENTVPTFWTTGYMPNGAKVSFTVPIYTIDMAYEEALAFTNKLLADGFLLSEPGLEDGEHKETVTAMTRRVKINDDGTETPIIDLYVGKLNFAFLKVYLNTAEDAQAFVEGCGFACDQLPLYDGQAAIERGKNPRLDTQYIKALANPVQIAYRNNPAYEDGGKKAKRLFVRWLQNAPKNAHQAANTRETTPQAVTTPKAQKTASNGDNPGMIELGSKTFTWLMGHPELKELEPQNQHRANIIKQMNQDGKFAQCASVQQILNVILLERQEDVFAQ